MASGKVALVGAGPGDPGLLTLRARALLEAADTVIYDRLVCDDVLALAKGAKMVYVGKEKSHHLVPQDQINEILVKEAQEADLVVRLKGGDPYVFGRGGEEAEYLVEHGIEFEVVPGVTSALAALSHAGIPATFRGMAQSVHIITGHARQNGELDIDYKALCNVHGTLVFLMAVTSMSQITGGLLEAGMNPSTPAAVVQNGTLPSQRTVTATLENIVSVVKSAGITSPAILVVGEVCTTREFLDWKSKRPLSGATVVVCRAKDKQGALTSLLKEAGAQVIALPCIQTVACNVDETREALRGLANYAWLVLTSPVGVSRLFEELSALGQDARALAPVKIAAVGEATSAALLAHGIVADFIPEHFDGKHLGQGLAKLVQPGEKLMVLRAKKAAPSLSSVLDSNEIDYDDVVAYETVIGASEDDAIAIRNAIKSGLVNYVAFTSGSTVEGFIDAVGDIQAEMPLAACIGPTSLKAAKSHGFSTICAKNSKLADLVQAIIESWKSDRR